MGMVTTQRTAMEEPGEDDQAGKIQVVDSANHAASRCQDFLDFKVGIFPSLFADGFSRSLTHLLFSFFPGPWCPLHFWGQSFR